MNIKQSLYDMPLKLCHFFGKNVFFNYRFYQKLAPSLLIIMSAWIVYSQEIEEYFQGSKDMLFTINIMIAISTLFEAIILYRYKYIEYLGKYRKKSEKGDFYESGSHRIFQTVGIIFISLFLISFHLYFLVFSLVLSLV